MQDRTSPLEAEQVECADDLVRAAGNDAGSVEILDAQEPFPIRLASAKIAADGGNEGAEMQRTGGRGRKAPSVANGQPLSRGIPSGQRFPSGAYPPVSGSGRPDLRTAFRDAHGALELPRTTWRSDGLPAA